MENLILNNLEVIGNVLAPIVVVLAVIIKLKKTHNIIYIKVT